jgi:diguanylate cyclase (GGDEF)-like protein
LRYGGEEFALVMNEMRGNPIEVGERLRRAVAALTIPGPSGALQVTVSIGIAGLNLDDDLTSLLERADKALYQAKQGGRNQVRAA